MTPQSMSEVIDALEKKGLIERTPHPNHRRVFPAALTAKGRKVLEACDAAVDELEEEMLARARRRTRRRACATGSSPPCARCTPGFPRRVTIR